jgi:hypothetical protein
MLTNKHCQYGKRCKYAHSLREQKIDTIRHKVYSMLKNKMNLKRINLINDKKLFDTFLSLTKLCTQCIKGNCPGGYNCRNGALNIKYKICYDDFMYGNCRKMICNNIHLTKRGLIPYTIQRKNSKKSKYDTNKNDNKKYTEEQIKSNIKGILLTEQFLLSYFGSSNTVSDSNISEDSDEVKDIMKYLHSESDSDNSLDKSIFED